MNTNTPTEIRNFFVAGISYKKAEAAHRGQFAINQDQYENVLENAIAYNVSALFILSTCNRTEIYGFASSADELISLLCSATAGSKESFAALCYIKNGTAAVKHLFNVGSGLDSQILGDYEIVGQLKQAVKFAKERNFINCFFERLTNCVLQASKQIKNQTELSSGTISVSFAAVRFIKNKFAFPCNKRILVIGIGKIGRNTCKNLIDYLGTNQVTLMNRSAQKAAGLAKELNLKYAPMEEIDSYIVSSDIILVATNATTPVVLKKQLKGKGDKLVIDLSVPYNVEASARELPNITLINVDELSRLNDETLLKRQGEICKAQDIIGQHIEGFTSWFKMRNNAKILNSIKSKLTAISYQHPVKSTCSNHVNQFVTTEGTIQRVLNCVADKMRLKNQVGCQYIEAINEYMSQTGN